MAMIPAAITLTGIWLMRLVSPNAGVYLLLCGTNHEEWCCVVAVYDLTSPGSEITGHG